MLLTLGIEVRSVVGEQIDQFHLPVTLDPDLMEVNFGAQEGKPMGDWYDDWIADTYTPEGAEPFAVLRARTVRAINRATALPFCVINTSSPAAVQRSRLV